MYSVISSVTKYLHTDGVSTGCPRKSYDENLFDMKTLTQYVEIQLSDYFHTKSNSIFIQL